MVAYQLTAAADLFDFAGSQVAKELSVLLFASD